MSFIRSAQIAKVGFEITMYEGVSSHEEYDFDFPTNNCHLGCHNWFHSLDHSRLKQSFEEVNSFSHVCLHSLLGSVLALGSDERQAKVQPVRAA